MKFIFAVPAFPFFVVIIITPFEPLEPKIAVAEASFNIENDSISLKLMSANGSVGALVLDKSSLLITIPSITIRGWLLPVMDAAPLILILMPWPSLPFPAWMLTPGEIPCKACSKEVTGLSSISLPFTVAIAPVILARFWSP